MNDFSAPSSSPVALAGGTGDLGGRIARALLAQDASVRALVRPKSSPEAVAALRRQGAQIAEVDFDNAADLAAACEGAACVVSALSGLRGVVVEAQSALLEAAVGAGVPRFIPSDYSIDFRKLPTGGNRNFDLRRAFQRRLEAAPIQATSVFNGAFVDVLTEQAPILLFRLRRVLYWGDDPGRPLDFTTKDDTAAFTARAALDRDAPRALHVAGSRVSARDLAAIMTEVSGARYRLWRGGSLRTLGWIIAAVRTLFPQRGTVFPVWQGMQYMRDMFDERAQGLPLDNERYPGLAWTPVRDVLARRP